MYLRVVWHDPDRRTQLRPSAPTISYPSRLWQQIQWISVLGAVCGVAGPDDCDNVCGDCGPTCPHFFPFSVARDLDAPSSPETESVTTSCLFLPLAPRIIPGKFVL